MELVLPGIGLIFWMTLSFLILAFILGKFGWPVIVQALDKRETKITESLELAEKTREEMKALQANNEQLLREAKEERDSILAEARKISQKMYDEAKEKANEEAQRILTSAKENIHYEQMKAIAEVRNTIAELSLEIAGKVLSEEMKENGRHTSYVNRLVDEIKLN
ncbi:MAG: F0F1 ATP synthase subunit B [Bacteroidales bacterium]|jgi:F-type H+-transporting ATPase subunit b|nr:F0F1 ATP synthase subunit B [Bacteroidales bacterium]MBR4339293.1 F0F1 ATP synthase subunit B [Bacteroidales bacterium]MBR4491032.1 F0F1 ATP synthase subunit B [Bacteroidales bacterium]MBR4512081.1 F0F1 ATP synthase subunit B [Bacteroidales bacterium]MBR6919084.1 F0F1 ATP synthase subunit B [Bacteroidales bacterium]